MAELSPSAFGFPQASGPQELDPSAFGFGPDKATPQPPRSATGEIANQFKAGILSDLPKMAGQAMQYASDPGNYLYERGKGMADWATEQGNRPDLQPQEDQHNFLTNALASGARMIPQSIVPAAVVGAGIAGLGALASAPVSAPLALGATAVLGSLPAAMSQGQETLDKGLSAGLSKDDALKAARINAAIEGGGETLGTYAGGKLFGIGAKAAGKATRAGVEGGAGKALQEIASPATLKPWLKQLPETAFVETGTEIGQNAGEAAVENAYGIDSKSPYEAGKEAIAPTLGMTALLAPFGLAGFASNAHSARQRASILASPDAPKEVRAQISSDYYAQLAKVDPAAAKNFKANASRAIVADQGLTVDESMFAPAAPSPITAAAMAGVQSGAVAQKRQEQAAPTIEATNENEQDGIEKTGGGSQQGVNRDSSGNGLSALRPVSGDGRAVSVRPETTGPDSTGRISTTPAATGRGEYEPAGNQPAAVAPAVASVPPEASAKSSIASPSPQNTPPAPALPVTPAAPIANDQQAESAGAPTTSQAPEAPGADSDLRDEATKFARSRTDDQLAALVESGRPGYKEAAVEETARREKQKQAIAAAPKAPFVAPQFTAPGQQTDGGRPLEQTSAPMSLGEYGKSKTAPAVTSQPPAATAQPPAKPISDRIASLVAKANPEQLAKMAQHKNATIKAAAVAEVARQKEMSAGNVGETLPEGRGPATVKDSLSVQTPNSETLVRVRTVYGGYVRIRQQDLDGTRTMIPMYRADGSRVTTEGKSVIHRENLDPTGEKQKARNQEFTEDVIGADHSRNVFATPAAAKREASKRGVVDTHEVVPASDIMPGANGYVLRKKTVAPVVAHETAPDAPQAPLSSADAPQTPADKRKADLERRKAELLANRRLLDEASTKLSVRGDHIAATLPAKNAAIEALGGRLEAADASNAQDRAAKVEAMRQRLLEAGNSVADRRARMEEVRGRLEAAKSAAEAQHIEGKTTEAATAPVIAESLKKGVSNSGKDLRQEQDGLLKTIDAAIAVAPMNAEPNDTVTFDVPGDGKFKITNSRPRLEWFRGKIAAMSKGFAPIPKPTKHVSATTRIQGGKASDQTIRDMLDEGDLTAALELSKVIGKPLVFGNYDATKVAKPLAYTDAQKFAPRGFGSFEMVSAHESGSSSWRIIELSTGLATASWKTMAAAESGALAAFKSSGPQKLAETIEQGKKDGNTKDQATLEAEWVKWAEQEEYDKDHAAENERKAREAKDAALAADRAKWEELTGEKPDFAPGARNPFDPANMNPVATLADYEKARKNGKGDEFLDYAESKLDEEIVGHRPTLETIRRIRSGNVSGWQFLGNEGAGGIPSHEKIVTTKDGREIRATIDEDLSAYGMVREDNAIKVQIGKDDERLTFQQAREQADRAIDALMKPRTEEAPNLTTEIPPAVKGKIERAITRLRDIEQALEGVDKAHGKGHILALEVRDQQGAIAAARATLDEFRKMAPGNNVDAEAVIKSMGDEPDFERFGKAAEDAATTPENSVVVNTEFGRTLTPDSLNLLRNPVANGDTIQFADGEKWVAKEGWTGGPGAWTLLQGKKEHPTVRGIKGQSEFIRAILAAEETAKGQKEAPAWHTTLPTEGLPITDDQRKSMGYEKVGHAIAADAYAAITKDQFLASGEMYAYYLPAADGRNGIVRLLPDDQTPGKPWALLNGEAIRAGMAPKERVIAKLTNWLRSAPVVGDTSAPKVAEKKPAKPAESKQGKPGPGRYVAPSNKDNGATSQRIMADRARTTATLTMLNEYVRKTNPDAAYADSEIANVATDRIDAVRDWLIASQKDAPTDDTGLTTSGGNNDRIASREVYVADLIRDRKYDAAPDATKDDKNTFSVERITSGDKALPIVEHITAKGKTLRGTIRKDLTHEQAKAIDRFTFKKDGGYFIRESATTGPEATDAVTEGAGQSSGQKAGAQAAKLRAAGEKIIADADEAMGRDRLTNTAKRARQASGAEAQAAQNKVIGETMIRIADAIEDGSATHLAGITSRAQVEQLDSIMVRAIYATDTAKGGYALQESNKGRPFSDKDLASVKMPGVSKWREGFPKSKLIEAINGKRGAPLLRAEILRSDGYTQAIHDKVKSLLTETAIKDAAGWDSLEALSRIARLERAGITNAEQLRAAINEYAQIRANKTEINRAKALERALIGQKVGIDFFPTPKTVAADMVRKADIQPGMSVLEPSAGNGNIAEAIQAAGVAPDVVEMSSSLREILDAKGFNLVGQDFMNTTGKYDRIIMNPPFSNRLDAEHVQHAYSLLNPGGKIVAIMGEGVFFGNDAKAAQFREWLDSVGGTSEKMPEGTFTDRTLMATTGANSRMVEIEKPGDVRYNVFPEDGRIDRARLVANVVDARKSFDKFSDLAAKGGDASFEEYSRLLDDVMEAENRLVDSLAQIPDDAFGLNGKTADGRMVTLNPSAQDPGKYQLTRFDKKGEPCGDTQYPTKAQAIKEFLDSVEAESVQSFEDGARYNVATDTQSSPSDKAIYSMAAEGKTAAEILAFIGKASRRPFNRYLANALRNLGASSSVTLDSQGGWQFGNSSRAQKYAAAYNPKTDTIALFTAREAERHVLHEFVHSVSLKAIAAGGPASIQMRGLYLHLKRTGALDGQYGMSNLDEFVAEAFSNPKFQQALRDIPAPKGSALKSAWEWFVRAVARALGLKTPAMETALDRAMRAGAELMRENAALAGKEQGNDRYAIAWHGTPHVWAPEPGFPHGRPRLDKMGSGEGEQVYGWGWYSAQSQDTAEWYRRNISGAAARVSLDGSPLLGGHYGTWPGKFGISSAVADRLNTWRAMVESGRSSSISDAPASLRRRLTMSSVGSAYQLDIPDDVIPTLLDWDKPLREQSAAVRAALSRAGMKGDSLSNAIKIVGGMGDTGASIYKYLATKSGEYSEKKASELMRKIGIPGLRYLDGQSRDSGDGTSNYVIWDQQTLDRIALLERNGEKLDAIRAADEVRYSKDDALPDTITINGIERPTTNSNGKPIAQDEAGVRRFWEWFAGSKITDDQGRPLVVYHNSPATGIIKFLPFARDTLNGDKTAADVDRIMDVMRYSERLSTMDFRSGNFFSPSESDYAGYGKNQYAVYLKADNPIMFDGGSRKAVLTDKTKKGDALIIKNQGKINEIAVIFPEQVKSATQNTGQFSPENPDIRYSLITDWADSPRMAPVRGVVTNAMHSDKATSWLTPFNTQYHKAEKWAAEGKTGFKRVFDLGQKFLSDVSRFAIIAQDEAPTLFHEIRSVGDAVTSLRNIRSIGDLTGAKHKADIEAIASPLYEGTLYGGGSPTSGIIFSDSMLRANYKLTDRQIKLYREALAAVSSSMDEMAKSVIAKHAKNNEVEFDAEVTVGEMADGVIERLEDRKDDLEYSVGTEEQERVEANIADLREMDRPDEADNLKRQFDKTKSDAEKALARIDETIEDIRGIVAKNQSLQDHGYFPLMRFGKHTVTAKDIEGKVQYFGMFDGIPLVPRSGQYQANTVAAAIRAEHPEWTVTTGIKNDEEYKLYNGLNLEAIQLFADHMSAEDLEPYQEFLRQATGDRSVMKRLIHRKGTPGFDRDVRRTLSQFIVSNARHTSSSYHMGDMLKAAKEAGKDGGDIGAEAVKLQQYVAQPQEEAHALRGFLFFNFLGGSIASALVNLSQVPMMTFPYLTRYESSAALAKRLAAAGKMAVGDVSTIGGALGAALHRAEQDGVTAPQEIHQLTATAANNIFSGSRGVNAALRLWGAPFAMAESFNRRVTFIAAFQIAEKMTPAQLAEAGAKDAFGFAEKAVTDTQGIYCVDEETECLTLNGWKKHSEMEAGEKVYAVDELGRTVESSLIDIHRFANGGIEATEFRNSNGFSMVLTDHHKCLIQIYDSRKKEWTKPRKVMAKDVIESHYFLRAPTGNATDRAQKYSDDEVMLFAWVASEGHLFAHRSCVGKRGVGIVQSNTHNPQYVIEIDELLERLGGHFNRKTSGDSSRPDKMVTWQLRKPLWEKIHLALPGKMLTHDLVADLTIPQMRLFLETFAKGDGHFPDEGGPVITQKDIGNLSVLQAMAVVSGTTSTLYERMGNHDFGAIYLAKNSKRACRGQMTAEKITLDMAWCPETEHGTWIARRNGRTFVTGNSKANRPNVGRGAVGATLMTFKQFSIMYLELLLRMPRNQQLLMLGIMALAAGAGGLPFAEDAEDIIDTLGQWLGYGTNSKKWVRNTTESVLGQQVADIAINGALSQMGIDLHSRFGMQNLLPGSGALKQSSIDKGRDAAEFFGPAASVLKNAATALQELATGHAGRAALAVAPNAVQNAIKGADMAATGYAEDAKGRRTVPVNGLESIAKGIGFNPKAVADFGAIKSDIAQDQRMVQVKREEFTSAIADAILSGDVEERQQAMSDMRQWNEDNPNLRVVIAPGAISKRVLAAKQEGADRFLKTVSKPMRTSARSELIQ